MPGKLKVTLVKSTVSHTARTRATVRALGLHRIGDTVEISDTPEMRGMTRAVRFLLRTEDTDQAATPRSAESSTPVESPAAVESAATASRPAPKRTRKTTEEASE